ncbi:hypothetical protein CBL_03655 [Carabus blaptoides fortunei]
MSIIRNPKYRRACEHHLAHGRLFLDRSAQIRTSVPDMFGTTCREQNLKPSKIHSTFLCMRVHLEGKYACVPKESDGAPISSVSQECPFRKCLRCQLKPVTVNVAWRATDLEQVLMASNGRHFKVPVYLGEHFLSYLKFHSDMLQP